MAFPQSAFFNTLLCVPYMICLTTGRELAFSIVLNYSNCLSGDLDISHCPTATAQTAAAEQPVTAQPPGKPARVLGTYTNVSGSRTWLHASGGVKNVTAKSEPKALSIQWSRKYFDLTKRFRGFVDHLDVVDPPVWLAELCGTCKAMLI